MLRQLIVKAKPELLLPAGSPEAFIAALEGGADAIYLGLQNFNARGRAKNFQINHLPDLLSRASAYRAKLYITLNTLIKNSELVKLLEYLEILQHYPPAAVIIQDWGVYYLLRRFYPHLTIHSSTQMGNHNSLDCRYAGQLKFQRVILAREVTLLEVTAISANSQIELEIFTHGALCYSISGSCLFSSWIGGMSANRGKCRQPCRHLHSTPAQSERFFSMKDLELIDYIPAIAGLGIKAIKIEGRMRSANYVYTVAKAYRLALDHPDRIDEAKQLLQEDGGREKTQWFFPGQSTFATTGNSYTGSGIGQVISNSEGYIGLRLIANLKLGDYIRIQPTDDKDSEAIRVEALFDCSGVSPKSIQSASAEQIVHLLTTDPIPPLGSIVFEIKHLATASFGFTPVSTVIRKPDRQRINQILEQLVHQSEANSLLPRQTEIYLRVADLSWLELLKTKRAADILPQRVKCLIPIHLSFVSDSRLDLIPELPYFTPEADLPVLSKRVNELHQAGFTTFCISRLSQSHLFAAQSGVNMITNEQVYCTNDAAIALLKQSRNRKWVLPLENDFPNLVSSENREGIVPLYFHPVLFYSRQSVMNEDSIELTHSKKIHIYHRENGIVKVMPKQATCNFNFYPRLFDRGYRRFLLDFSFTSPDVTYFQALMEALFNGKNIEGTNRFNMKQGLW